MTGKTDSETCMHTIDISSLMADPNVTEIKTIRGVPIEFRTRIPAKVVRDMDMNPETNPNWEYDLVSAIVVSPDFKFDEVFGSDVTGLDAKVFAEIVVECLEIAGLNARPTFR